MTNRPTSENVLWSSFVKGNMQSYADIYKMFSQSLVQYGYKITPSQVLIKDALQELFLELWNTRKSKSNVQNVKAYLLKSYRYKLLKALKANVTTDLSVIQSLPQVTNAELSIITKEIEREQSYVLRKMINNLPSRQNELIHLRYYQNLTISEIAEVLDIKKQSVSNLINRALANLKTQAKNKNAIK